MFATVLLERSPAARTPSFSSWAAFGSATWPVALRVVLGPGQHRDPAPLSFRETRLPYSVGMGDVANKTIEMTRIALPMATSPIRARRTAKWPLMPTRKRTLARYTVVRT